MAKPARAKPTAPAPAESEQKPVERALPAEFTPWRFVAESGATITLTVEGSRVVLQANGPHAPLCPPARLTFSEAMSIGRQLGYACNKGDHEFGADDVCVGCGATLWAVLDNLAPKECVARPS